MNVKSDEERKSKVLKIRLNDKELAKLKQYTEESGLRSMSEYIFNSIIATPIIELTDEELAPEKARFKKISDRINSIAIQVNQTGNIYPEDMQEIRQGVEEISARLAEYQAKLENKIALLKQTIMEAKIIDTKTLDTSSVQMLTTVGLKNRKNGMQMKYTIVSESEANLREGKISVGTPIAQGLLGKHVGDVANIKVPAGMVELEITSINFDL